MKEIARKKEEKLRKSGDKNNWRVVGK